MNAKPPLTISTRRRSSLGWITVFGLGHMKPASGTWGSMPPVVIAGAMIAAGFGPVEHPIVYHAVLVTILLTFSAACVVQGDQAEARFGEKDPGQAVADETAGQCFSLMALPAVAVQPGWHAALTLLGAFLAFRVLDIIKPWPANGLQRVPGGWGILLDDVIAGLYAMLAVQLMARVLVSW